MKVELRSVDNEADALLQPNDVVRCPGADARYSMVLEAANRAAGAGHRHHFVRMGTNNDGCCFYDAFCRGVMTGVYFGLEDAAKQHEFCHGVRKQLARTLHGDKWNTYVHTRFIEEEGQGTLRGSRIVTKGFEVALRQRIRDPHTWADVYPIMWMCEQFGVSCVFLDAVNDYAMHCGVRGKVDADTFIVIVWTNRSHFELLCLVDERGDTMRCSVCTACVVGRAVIDAFRDVYEHCDTCEGGCRGVTTTKLPDAS